MNGAVQIDPTKPEQMAGLLLERAQAAQVRAHAAKSIDETVAVPTDHDLLVALTHDMALVLAMLGGIAANSARRVAVPPAVLRGIGR